MSMIIGKFRLRITEEQTIDLPIDATILSVKEQNDMLCLWALFTEGVGTRQKTIYIRGTGHPSKGVENLKFLDSVVMRNGFVWHVFI